MAWRYPLGSRNAALDAIYDRANAGAAAGTLKIYTGAQPAAGAAVTGTLLVTVTLNDPAFAAASNGSKALNDPPAATAVADGTAGWFRVADSDGNQVADGACGTAGAELNLATTTISTGVSVDLSGGSVTFPSGD